MRTFALTVVSAVVLGPGFAPSTAEAFVTNSRAEDAKSGKNEDSIALRTMRKYLELINAGRFEEVGDLFAVDAVFLTPTRQTLVGRDSIRRFYAVELARLKPTSQMGRFVADGQRLAFELEGHSTAYPSMAPQTVVDFVDVNAAGEITRLAVYTRGNIETSGETAQPAPR